MMRNIAIGLATATITIGASTLSTSALYGHESGVSKGTMGWAINGRRFRPRTYGFAELTPHEREHLRAILGARYERLSPLERQRLMGIARERVAELTPRERQRLRANAHERFAELTPRERERIRTILGERYERLSPLERERFHRHGPYSGRR
jgi:hypothetical protein